jgi:transcriptional accessory protein Tex/SPT6
VAEVIATLPAPKPIKVVVSEAGASVYSASAKAAAEMPDLDVSLRGAVSIARRLQDPLAELVKIDPKAIGVEQYQHDVNQTRLARALDAVVEDAVNAVGVDLNTASASLLSRVFGLSASLAGAIIVHRDQARRTAILDGIRNQGKLTGDLEAKIALAVTKTELEDIYLVIFLFPVLESSVRGDGPDGHARSRCH